MLAIPSFNIRSTGLALAATLFAFPALAQVSEPPELISPSGEAFVAADYEDQVRLINFWAAWCAPCRIEMPDLDELHAHYDSQQFTVLGVAADEMDLVNLFLDKTPVDYPIYVGDPDAVFEWTLKLGNRVLGLPFSVLVDRGGNIRWIKTGGRISVADLTPVIDSIIAEEQPKGGPPIGAPDFEHAPPPSLKPGSTAKRAEAGDQAPDGIGITMARSATAAEYSETVLNYVPWEDAAEIQPLPKGESLPAGSVVRTVEGEMFDLNAAVREKPTVLIYFRGGWCPFCSVHLRQLQHSVPELETMGYQILAVSTDPVEGLQDLDTATNYTYTLLSDGDLDLATKLGLKFKVSEEYIAHIKVLPNDAGFDLVERNGGYLATPATYIFDTNGVARFVYANNNYTVRISQDALIKAAKEALAGP